MTTSGAVHRSAAAIGNVLGVVALVLFIPFAILAVGIPIVVCVRLVVWALGML